MRFSAQSFATQHRAHALDRLNFLGVKNGFPRFSTGRKDNKNKLYLFVALIWT
jgi:hypothetical protein